METLVMFLLTGSLIQGVLCSYKINLPNRVEALKGSCVFIPCTFDIGQNLKNDLTDSAKRKWFKGKTLQFDSSSPNNGPLKGEIFGTATQKNCTTCFDNISQSHKGSYYFRLEGSDTLQYSYKEPKHSQVQIVVLESPPKPTLRVFKDQQELMKMMEVIEGSSVNLRCSTKIFCPSRPPSLRWSSSLNENVTEKQYQNQTELISDLNLTVSHRHHRVTFTCTATHQLQQPITTQESWMLLVQYAPRNTSVTINPAGLVLEGRSVTLSCSSNANPAVNYTWYRDTNGLLNPVQTGPNLTINDTDSTHSGQYYCTAENKRGTQNISLLLDVQCFHYPSVLLGAAVIASVMMSVCIMKLCYERKRKEKPSETTSGLILTHTTVALDNDGQFVDVNNGMPSSTALSAPESLHYSSINFINTEPPSGEIRGIASLTSEYAAVQDHPAGAAENNNSTSEAEPKKQKMTAEITDTPSEDVIYENTSHRYRQKEPLVSADCR
uniref:Ig-like domain-containing protein n=1 Tax=Cyprinus carpio carpio TaxID=630221 RepID=A0A9J8CJY8_CYPCA